MSGCIEENKDPKIKITEIFNYSDLILNITFFIHSSPCISINLEIALLKANLSSSPVNIGEFVFCSFISRSDSTSSNSVWWCIEGSGCNNAEWDGCDLESAVNNSWIDVSAEQINVA